MRIFFIVLLFISSSFATNVVVSYPYIKDLVEKIAKDKLEVTTLSDGRFDPHFVVAKPSLILKVKRADALIINGGQLEIGWLPALIKRASNRKINEHFLELSRVVKLSEKPVSVSRADGDVHPDGNPHFIFDPHNVPALAKTITQFLASLDEKNSQFYKNNLEQFLQEWKTFLNGYDHKMSKLKNLKVVQFHKMYSDYFRRYNIQTVATIEPLPGVSPSAKDTFKLVKKVNSEKVKFIVLSSFNPKKSALFIESKTDAKVITLPADAYEMSLEQMYDRMLSELNK
ncbi:MAG: zinc ABC transporter solute-binding protein [Helicobacteraceae bacterium]|nr:zinc ABC transporter solute-binding protein [Helicobacteraceae bacterium]